MGGREGGRERDVCLCELWGGGERCLCEVGSNLGSNISAAEIKLVYMLYVLAVFA